MPTLAPHALAVIATERGIRYTIFIGITYSICQQGALLFPEEVPPELGLPGKRYAEAKGYDVSASADLSGYPDAGQVQDYAQPAMAWAVAENIIQGMEDGTLKPAGNASRAQIATILMRFCEDVAQ